MVIPAELRRRHGRAEGSPAIAEAVPDGVLFRAAVTAAIKLYTAERKPEILLANAVDQTDDACARV